MRPRVPCVSCLLAAILGGLAFSCRQDSSVDATAGPASFNGITATDGNGNILRIDADDWRPIPESGLSLRPVYPNPCTSRDGTILDFRISTQDSIRIVLLDRPTHIIDIFLAARLQPGLYSYRLRLVPYEPGIYRVEFRIVRAESTLATYGDVEIRSLAPLEKE